MRIDKLIDKHPVLRFLKKNAKKQYISVKTEVKSMYNELIHDEFYRETHNIISSRVPEKVQRYSLNEVVSNYFEIKKEVKELGKPVKTALYH